jgi:hypothetical protein
MSRGGTTFCGRLGTRDNQAQEIFSDVWCACDANRSNKGVTPAFAASPSVLTSKRRSSVA